MSQFELADRLKTIPPYPFATIAKRVRELEQGGADVIRLDIGSPDLAPPDFVVEALYRSAQHPTHHGYGGFSGTPQLRQAFADYYRRRFEVEVDPDKEVLPLIGSKEGIFNLNLTLVNPGDVVLVPDPAYTTYEAGAVMAGGEAYHMALKEENGFLPDLKSIPAEIVSRAKLMWVNYPNNPTGALATVDDYSHMVEFCAKNGILLCSDNPYSEVAFDGLRPPSLLEVAGAKDTAIEFNSLSKSHNMAGWRVGVALGNAQVIDALLRTKSNIDSGHFRAVMDAAVVALNQTSEAWLVERNRIYQERRDAVVALLDRVGLVPQPAPATIYVWARVRDGQDMAYATEALEKAHVTMAPGTIYGDSGRGYVRFSLVQDVARITEAMDRLAQWWAGR